ncbi:MAG: KUP/HAK/KT family potassium transporter [Candidatus Eremiobacteraeota bacterium]|nr:KUP/HAK/KT family potassium transporter [Candidatus Eremiobacteraeota bacterium]
MAHPDSTKRAALAPLALGALGVVFGDIGTSPLYAFRQSLSGDHPVAVDPANVYGILSLIFWALIVVVCIKYVTFVLRADYDGQGGILALLGRLSPPGESGFPSKLFPLALVALAGAAMLYGDGMITPAISVMSAVEGLGIWTHAAEPYVVPITIAILFGLFAMQKTGTGRLGMLFGPVMVVWFVSLGVFGALGIARNPAVFEALNPAWGFGFLARHGVQSLLVLGAVVLCVTGVEDLYADLAHFGRVPITIAWYGLVLPSLVLNYFGQGAVALATGSTGDTFYALFPRALLVPELVLATVATVIASQALISGIYSITQQASQLGYSPRFRTVHTSDQHEGQIYMPAVTAFLAFGCIALVLAFRSSAALGSAYGLAVTATMLATTICFGVYLRRVRHWKLATIVPLLGLFLMWDLPFLAGNLLKIVSGAWLPIVIAGFVFVIFTTWNRGRRRMMRQLTAHEMPVDRFKHEVSGADGVGGTAIFLTPSFDGGIPFVLKHAWLREHIAFDAVVLLTIRNVPVPRVDAIDRLDVLDLGPSIIRVRANYGFMQSATIADILRQLHKRRPNVDAANVTYYLASPKIYAASGNDKRMHPWELEIYRWLLRNARPLTDSLRLPPNRVVEFGVEVRL